MALSIFSRRKRMLTHTPAHPNSGQITSYRTGIRRALRRHRGLLVALLAVGALVAALTGISLADHATWADGPTPDKVPLSARFGAATAYDIANDEMVVFGGFGGANGKAPVLGDTWAFKPRSHDDEEWIDRNPVTKPTPRGFASMAYDDARKNAVMFGGRLANNTISGETWTWDGKDWTLQNPPEPRPDPRRNAAMVYDPHHHGGVVVMFGGRTALTDADNRLPDETLNDTWIWDGSTWKIMPSAGAPAPRHSAAMAYDLCRAEAVMFGGFGIPAATTGFDPAPGETWTWNGAKWANMTPQLPAISPPARAGASMIYSSFTGRDLLYGGIPVTDTGSKTAAADPHVWMWNGTGWDIEVSDPVVQPFLNFFGGGRSSTVPPQPRAYASWAYDLLQGRGGIGFGAVHLYGGTPAIVESGGNTNQAILGRGSFTMQPGEQVALGDQYKYSEQKTLTHEGNDLRLSIRSFGCPNPVPIPTDEAPSGDQINGETSKVEVREGMREIGQLPVLLGADWPANQRNPRLPNSTNPNPKYTPPPDCPNRNGFESGQPNEYGLYNSLVTDPQRNRIYQFFICDPNRGSVNSGGLPPQEKLLIRAYHGATLEPLGRVVISSRAISSLSSLLFDDTGRGRFLFRISDNALQIIQKDLIDQGVNPVAGQIDITGIPAGVTTRDFFRHPKTGLLKAFFTVAGGGATAGSPPSQPPSQSTPPKLGQWDIEDRREEDWKVELPGCAATIGSARMRSGSRAYTSCNQVSGKRLGVVRVSIAESADGSETPGTVEVFPGPYQSASIWSDPEAERMVILSSNSNAGDRVYVFDGKKSRFVGIAGISPKGSGLMYGFDPGTGRLYVHLADDVNTTNAYNLYQIQGGVLLVDTRSTPVSQPLIFPQFSSPPNFAHSPATWSAGPGDPRRVFIRRGEGTMNKYPDGEKVSFPRETFYRVLADEIPLLRTAEISDLDALTIAVPHNPAKTEVSFDAEGSGYGIRLRSVGGIWSALRPSQQIYDSDYETFVDQPLLTYGRPVIPNCLLPDRELVAGWVPNARLSDFDAGARSSGLEVDSNSKTDLTGLSSRCNPPAGPSDAPPSTLRVFDVLWPLWQLAQSEGNKAASTGTVETGKDADGTPDPYPAPLGTLKNPSDGTPLLQNPYTTPFGTIEKGKDADGNPTAKFQGPVGTSWDHFFKEVECVGDALKTYQATVGNIYGSADCVQRQGHVEATARGSAPGIGPAGDAASKQGFSVSEGYSNVVVSRDPAKGVVVTSTAIAKGIQIPGLNIGLVETKAVAWSNGRPGEERASFTRKICGVITPDYTNGKCLSTGEQQQMVDNWNKGWGINSKMYLPTYDAELYQGSPGGYIAGVIKPKAEQIESELFDKDFQREVPGLVIVFYKDSRLQGPGRQSLQLAAVRAVTGFGVQCNADHIYSPQAQDCVAIPNDLLEEEFFEEDEEFFEEDDPELDGEWTEVGAIVDPGESLGSKIGRLLDRLPVLRNLPIRQMGEALLLGSVWMLLGFPLFLASRRFALINWRF